MDRVLAFRIHLHRLQLRRSERLRHVLLDVVRPANDVDLLAVQLAHDVAHARALHANARPYGIHVLVMRPHGQLRPVPGIARHAHDLHDAFGYLGNLQAKESAHKLGGGAAETHRGPSIGILLNLADYRLDRVAHAVVFGGDALLCRQQHLGLAHQHVEVAPDDRRDGAGHDLADASAERSEHVVVLGFAYLLHDHLAGGLRRDASETGRRHLDLDGVAFGGIGLEAARARHGNEARPGILVRDDQSVVDMELERLAVNGHAQVVCHAWIVARRLLNRLLYRTKHDLALNAALTLDVSHHRQQVIVHGHNLTPSCQKTEQPLGDSPNHRKETWK